jgi:glycosyltransferase involved in cell wall biosynthesis
MEKNSMKIDVLTNDGSPIGVTLKDLWGEGNRGIGIGGSEYAMLTMCEEWHKAGHELVLYNNPMTIGGSPFEQRGIHTFDPNEDRDVLIIFRSPNSRSLAAKGLKIWWSCDQETIGDFAQFAGTIHKIVCISPRHAKYFAERYNIQNTEVIDLPVRVDDFKLVQGIEKVPYRMIFTSVPDRGLQFLYRYWNEIQMECPEVSLVITSDYRLWGIDREGVEGHRSAWSHNNNVIYLGAIPRIRLIEEQLKAEILAYPNVYDELFCVSIAEAQCAGIYPITSSVGALETTNMGMVIRGNPQDEPNFRSYFINIVVKVLNQREELTGLRRWVQQKALDRFNPKAILQQWDEKIFK